MRRLLELHVAALLIACGGGSGATTDEGDGGTVGATTGGGATTGNGPGPTTGDVGGTATGGGTTTGVSPDCAPILNQADLETGFESCDDGSKRRYEVLDCPTEKTTDMNPCQPGCMADGECTDQPLGYCAQAHMLAGYCGCFYGCQKDADCGAGSICECGVVVGRCVPASCTTNADCAPGFGCVATREGNAGPACTDPSETTSYACQSAADLCHGDADCPADGIDDGACFLVGDHRECGTVCAQPP